ncbi:MAG: hypothetical protein M3N11_01165 [Actinomycetota bacterium]|nr:hypothetical protein [Actinomycetota bacterium]
MSAVDGTGTSGPELQAWVHEELGLPPSASIAVSEQPGTDPRCSPVVTQVSIVDSGGERYDFHIERGLEEVTRMDVVAALAFGGGH